MTTPFSPGAEFTPRGGDELISFILVSLPIIGEYRAASDFADHPSWLGATVIAGSAVDLGAVVKDGKREFSTALTAG